MTVSTLPMFSGISLVARPFRSRFLMAVIAQFEQKKPFSHQTAWSYSPEAEKTPWVVALLEICIAQQEQIQMLKEQVQGLKDEIARMKGQKPKPEIKPSGMEKNAGGGKEGDKGGGKRPGSLKRNKTSELEVHQTILESIESKTDDSGTGTRTTPDNQRYGLVAQHIHKS